MTTTNTAPTSVRPGRAKRSRSVQVRPTLPASPQDPWTAAADHWTEHLATQGRTPATIEGYRRHVGWLAGDMTGAAHPVLEPWRLTTDELEAWLDAQPWSNATRSRVLASLKSFYSWAVTTGRCRRSPLSGIARTPQVRPTGPRALDVPPAWREPLARHDDHLSAASATSSTIRSHRDILGMFARAHDDPWTVTSPELTRWLSRVDWTPNRKRAVRSVLRTFYGQAHKAGRLPTNPTEDLPRVRIPRAMPRPATDQAVQHALELADDRTRLALRLALYAGLRRAEIASLHARDIGPDTLRVRGKGGRERTIPLHPDLRTALSVELSRRDLRADTGTGWGHDMPPADGWLFPGNEAGHLSPHRLGQLISGALPAGFTAHTLRHRFATQAYSATRDLRAVQELLGHSKPEVTAVYAAVPDGALASAVLGVGPGAHR